MLFKSRDGKCWLCGDEDLSREHRYKKSDLEREYFYQKDAGVVLTPFRGSTPNRQLQGAKSKLVKFKPSLCKKCNNEVSQPFDQAYDSFICYLKKNETELLETSVIRPDLVFGDKHSEKLFNLLRYFVKHLGCTLSEFDIEVPQVLLDFLNNHSHPQKLQIVISQSIDRKKYLDSLEEANITGSWIGCSDIQYEFNKTTNLINFVHYELFYRSFTFYIRIDENIIGFYSNIKQDEIKIIQYQEPPFQKFI